MTPPVPVTVFQTTAVPEFSPSNESFSIWKEKLDIHFCEINCTEDNQKRAVLLKSIGAVPYSVLHSLCSPEAPVTKTYKHLCETLTSHYTPPTIVFRERKKFHSSTKTDGETVADWYARSNGKAAAAGKGGSSGSAGGGGGSSNYGNKHNKQQKVCSHCGWRNHSSQYCKFKESKCHSCEKIGHLASVCSVKKNKTVNYVSNSDNNSTYEFNDLFNSSIFSISPNSNCGLYSLSVVIDGVSMEVACDTGAPCTLVPVSFYEQIDSKMQLRPCHVPYVDYSGERILILGEYDACISYKGIKKNIVVVVSKNNSPPLLGRTFLRAFNFELMQVNSVETNDKYSIVVEQIKNEFSEVFKEELGTFNISKISLDLCDNSKPVFFKPRPLPLAWKDRVEKQLRGLVQSGVLEHINNSEWGTPLVPILKPNGDLRICADYKVTINKWLVDFKYPLPRIEEIFASFNGGELFTKLDLSNAYNQLLLDEKSQLLCTWSTHIGLLKVKRLPFGVKTAAAIFQKSMETLLRGIPFVVVYQDDITITGPNIGQHITTLKSVLTKLKSAGLRLNVGKCEFFKSKICYLGFTIDKHGLSKNNDRISSVSLAPIPKDVSELRAFIGMVNYYSKFINNFSSKMFPLYELLRKNIKFIWSEECQKSYELIKSEVTSDQVLVHFNPDMPIILTTDASSNAVAGVLSHKLNEGSRPIAFVSRALTKSESNYSTLEKEALAIIFCVSKLKQYLLGNKFVLRTDHKPLLSIFGEHKGLPLMASARMQRWALILSGFEYTVEYIKGTLNDADGLSRMPQTFSVNDYDEINYVNYIESENYLNLSFKDIARETRRDPVLSKLSEAIQNGSVRNLKGNEFTPYRNKSDEFSVEYDCVLWGYRTIVPTKLRTHILSELHASHLGIVKTKMLARSYVWWPGMDADIENLIQNCIPCQELQPSPEKSSLIPWNPSYSVWSRVHADFAGPIGNFYFFIVIDSFSKWVEVFKTKEITSSFTISKLRELFCRYGLVDVLVTDNGRQFTSHEFSTFTKNNGVKHIFTAPGHPAANGQAENFVKILKKSILANLKDHKNVCIDTILNRFMVDYRNTKHCSTGESPAKLFFGRVLKTRFSSLKPPITREKILDSQHKIVANYKGNRNAEFSKGQKVMIRDYRNINKPSWTQATVRKQLGPRTYSCIITHNNREIKRHLDQIRNQNVSQNNNQDQQTEINVQARSSDVQSEIVTSAEGSSGDVSVLSDQALQSGTDRALRPRLTKINYSE
ncbi:uncharacterized protein K02A2.6-like [Eupeodes corollae]|uniref:uncharacterized protein K02A2.6-like n=1 Tax=Eupeodes corollae TaxID=290404 RepID=UPI002491F870|nr:uncharacterized protein K02A2.6-like [Eupeodes corollae]